jgi:hypothetical protein
MTALVRWGETVFSQEELLSLTDNERRDLIKFLVSLGVRPASPPGLWQRRAFVVGSMLGTAVVLAVWVIYLTRTLPTRHAANGWRVAWVGFDIAEVLAAVATAWAAWRYRHIVIASAVVTGTLLIADAWFDVVLSWGSRDWWMSMVLAGLVEIPAALVLWEVSRRLFLASLATARSTFGLSAELPPLRKISLFVPSVSAPSLDRSDPDPHGEAA